jgi:hypothetical protein
MPKEKPRKRIKIKGHYMQVRQRSTEKGTKGTIMAKWKSDKRGKKRAYRCKLSIGSRLQRFCGHSKAGSHCLKGGDRGDRCPQLVIAYQ